jgi:hypothetical protein
MIESTLGRAVDAAVAGATVGASLARQVNRLNSRAKQGVPRTLNPKASTRNFTRTTAISTVTLVAGTYSGFVDFRLNMVQVADIYAMYDVYRINSVTLHLVPAYDPGQSGITNNANTFVYAANEPSGQLTTPTALQIGAFDNRKVSPLIAGREFVYTFAPKASNTVAAGSYAVQTGWLYCDAAGGAIPHQRLLLFVTAPVAASVFPLMYYFTVNFSCRGAY